MSQNIPKKSSGRKLMIRRDVFFTSEKEKKDTCSYKKAHVFLYIVFYIPRNIRRRVLRYVEWICCVSGLNLNQL